MDYLWLFDYCPVCGQEVDNASGFCSQECEQKYGECPKCGAPSRGNRVCCDCRFFFRPLLESFGKEK